MFRTGGRCTMVNDRGGANAEHLMDALTALSRRVHSSSACVASLCGTAPSVLQLVMPSDTQQQVNGRLECRASAVSSSATIEFSQGIEKKIFGNVKKHAQRNASADALYVCTIVMPGKAVWRL